LAVRSEPPAAPIESDMRNLAAAQRFARVLQLMRMRASKKRLASEIPFKDNKKARFWFQSELTIIRESRETLAREAPAASSPARNRPVAPRQAESVASLRNGRGFLPALLGNLPQGFGIPGQFGRDALQGDIVPARFDRLLRVARRRFDGRSRLA